VRPLEGRIALVTGATQGLGRAFANAMAAAGATVAVNGRREDVVDEIVGTIVTRGDSAVAATGDISVPGVVDALIDDIVSRFGRFDVIVNNAGVVRAAMLWNLEDDAWADVLQVNLTAVFFGVRAAARAMIPQRSGRIINMASGAGIGGTIGQVNYAAAKGGVIALTKSAARELARHNITVNAISPVAATPMTERIRTDDKLYRTVKGQIPLDRFAEAEELGGVAVFLASDAAAYTTGHVLLADGGLSM